MSNYKRDTKFANSAIVVTVGPDQYGKNVFDGIKFQEELEHRAFVVGNGFIPIQKYVDYKNNRVSNNINIEAFKGNTSYGDINQIFSKFINDNLKEGIDYFNNKIDGFNSEVAVIAGVEARTSSPVRILRDDSCVSNICGIYPCGEGAGYAGGITTSAMDGLRVFENIYKKYKSDRNE